MAAGDKTITLTDGRTLAYTEHGDFSGRPVIFLHGNPGSRLMRHPDEGIAYSLGVRVITPDRPGYGLSDYQPERTLLDMPDDIAQLADQLGLEKFAIFGVSAGGPYVAACAYKMPEYIGQAAIVSGAAPMNREGAYEGMNDRMQAAFQMSARYPVWLLQPLIALGTRMALRDPEKTLADTVATLSQEDQQVLAQPAIRKQVMQYRAEATRNGVKGIVREAKILVSPWGFPLEDIRPEVHLWYWEDDDSVPVQMGRYLEQRIPNAVPHFLPGGGHFSWVTFWREILEALVADS